MRRHDLRQSFGVDAKKTENANEPTDETAESENPNPNRSTVRHSARLESLQRWSKRKTA